MESPAPVLSADSIENQSDVKGNGNLKRKHGLDASSDDETDFLGFDLGKLQNVAPHCDLIDKNPSEEQNTSQHMIQNIKKICTDSSSDETTPKRNSLALRATDVMDPAFKLPFKYGWKRELVSVSSAPPLRLAHGDLLQVLRAEPTMSKEKGEVYYITPTGKKLRTRHEILNNLHDDLTINNFTLVKEAIGAPTDDEIIRPAKFYNYSRRSNVDPVISEATPPILGKRVPKPKMPKGASPPPPNVPSTPTTSLTVPTFTPNHNKSVTMKENIQDANKPSNPTRKPAIKGKLK